MQFWSFPQKSGKGEAAVAFWQKLESGLRLKPTSLDLSEAEISSLQTIVHLSSVKLPAVQIYGFVESRLS